MHTKLTGKILGIAVVTGLMIFIPLITGAVDTKGKSEQSKVDVIEEKVEDSAITAEVKAKIFTTKGLESLDIHVNTEQGVVTLSGKVKNVEEIKLAEKIVRETKGVKGIENELSVK